MIYASGCNVYRFADKTQRSRVDRGRAGVARKADSRMIVWTCIIAGGADDGRIVLGWYPRGRPEVLSLQDSTGAVCEAVLVSFNREFSYAIFRHKTASPGQLVRAEAALKSVLEKRRSDVGPRPAAGKRKKSRPVSVLVARVFAEASTRLAAVQAARLPGLRRLYLLR
jgi:hypothetical protein